ncbi:glycine--tRNA ligase subunit beta [Candidatus Pseudothioglobus singularis]|nr:glycine--tRNA ligase subunit beta [Candidatus Pseudothioglobus singularis]MDB4821820.1 glycine--tRNA ligase subunit beta [Candidatus Pseudothioglobus singularis]MDC1541262.1 glycine--tRNA ligase subunit beta [Candidatus Pseudothioglobus singularis]
MKTHDFLLELGTEELPPKLLLKLSKALKDNLSSELEKLSIKSDSIKAFATPRRLAISISELQSKQQDQVLEKKGPSTQSPEMAINGFAKSCGVDVSELEKKELGGKEYFYYSKEETGQSVSELLPDAIEKSIKDIPITRAMKWGSSDYSFVRPVHWLVILLDKNIVPAKIMGLESNRITKGLRFIDPIIELKHAKDYEQVMSDKAQILVDFAKRKELIRDQVLSVAQKNNAEVVIDELLLDEVCALVEYPRAFSGSFDKKFLDIPQEAIISAMKSHQKYFHLVDIQGQLLPLFISVANIESTNIKAIVDGNERVIHPRLADSEFFWNQDKAKKLEERLPDLDSVMFMKSLGSMGQKAKRIESLSLHISDVVGFDQKASARAGLLSKSDLLSEMVGEFADLQGIMGGYYATNDGETQAVSEAIREHYQPRFAGDKVPSTNEGLVVAIADKLDTISGIYGIGQAPTGSKDPYALRRLALGLLRILLEAKIELNLKSLIDYSLNLHLKEVDRSCGDDIYSFMMDRLKAYYKDANIDSNVYEAVLAVSPESPLDFHLRVEALNEFTQSENSKSLIEANKRIANILKDSNEKNETLNPKILIDDSEIKLFNASESLSKKLSGSKDYQEVMKSLIDLKDSIDSFFDNVMVNTDDDKLKSSRLALIRKIRLLFLSVADISYLSS